MYTGIPAIDLQDHDYVIGADEVGYGCWAGPLVVTAVLAHRSLPWNAEVTDSKALTARKREQLADSISVPSWTVFIWPDVIDQLGIGLALREAYTSAIDAALQAASGEKTLVIADGTNPVYPGALMIPKADAKVKAVSMASIYAKVARDRHMAQEAKYFPVYGFERHSGYGTKQHQEALEKYGPCDLHRMSYAPLKRLNKVK